ncbi:DME family drug/metabolite transporter [Arthrobacter sp. B2I5]|uniref:DMT family transporter n=1 Tax=Arthrobacter sp. B2I5 TaxID=3042266 RepID=UPI0027880F3A|nr:DMT family transporter [Arthrobacter sp. B2I5]MDQ0827560.1 DME family drug/metabolite transporter [Arthrobacter sp. B2I5]
MNNTPHHQQARRWGALSVVAASILWGTTGTAATFAPAVSPLAIGAVAMGLGGLLQAVYAARHIAAQWGRLHTRWRLVLLGATAVAVYPLAFYSSMHLSGVAVGTVVSIGSAPVAAALIERFADGKRLSRQWILGAMVGIGGAALLSLAGHSPAPNEPGPGPDSWTSTAGILLGLLAGTTYALYSWAAHRLTGQGVTSRAAMGAVFGLGGILLMPVLAATGGPLLESWQAAGVGAYMAVVPMFAGYLLFGWGLARVGASTATGISLLETVVAAVLALLVVGERLPALAWLGAAVVLASLFILTPRRQPGAAEGRRAGATAAPSAPPPR